MVESKTENQKPQMDITTLIVATIAVAVRLARVLLEQHDKGDAEEEQGGHGDVLQRRRNPVDASSHLLLEEGVVEAHRLPVGTEEHLAEGGLWLG